MSGRRGRSSALALLFLAGPCWAWAQATATTAQIEGTVTDHTGVARAGATLIARNLDTGFERRTTSGADGRYRLVLLPLGRYQLVAELAGFAPARYSDLLLRVGETVTLHPSLQLAAATTVEVTAGASPVEVTRSLPAATLDERAIATLPINGRRFEDFVFLTPGTVPSQYAGRPVIGGQRGIHSAYVVDGGSYDNPFFGGIRGGERASVIYTISQEAIQEFQVTNAGYSAEFGRSGGGVVNAVTKSGTNERSRQRFLVLPERGADGRRSLRPPSDGFLPASVRGQPERPDPEGQDPLPGRLRPADPAPAVHREVHERPDRHPRLRGEGGTLHPDQRRLDGARPDRLAG